MDEGGPPPGVVLKDANQVPAPILLSSGLNQQDVLAPGEQSSWNNSHEFNQHINIRLKCFKLAFISHKLTS